MQEEQIESKAIGQIGKLLNFHLAQNDLETLNTSATIQGQSENVKELISFLQSQSWTSFSKFWFHAQSKLTAYVEKQDSYKAIRPTLIGQQKSDINNQVPWKRSKSYAEKQNFGKYFLSFDISSANFTVLKEILEIQSDWKSFITPFLIPTHSSPPDCLINSKFFRLFVFGKLAKLPTIWELKLLKLYLQVYETILNEPEIVHVNMDEIVISVSSPSQGQEIINFVNPGPEFKSKIFKLSPVDLTNLPLVPGVKNMENYCTLDYIDGQRRIMNVHPPHYNAVYLTVNQNRL